MRDKINNCINDSFEGYGNFRSSTAVNLLEQLFKEETLSFISFLRENYSAGDKYGDYFIDNNDWREFNSDKIYTTKEILNKFLENYE